MSVQTASLEVLEKAEVPPPQARAIVQAIEIEIAGAHTVLATKQDTLMLKQDFLLLKQDVFAAIHALELKIEALRSDLLRQMYTALFTAFMGQTGLLVGMAYFFVTHLKH